MDLSHLTRKEREEVYAEWRKREAERKEKQARFKPDPAKAEAAKEAFQEERKGKEELPYAGKLGRIYHPREQVRKLMIQGLDQASADDVHGRNERERAKLPNKPLTPNTLFRDSRKRKRPTHGLTTFGPKFKKPRKPKLPA